MQNIMQFHEDPYVLKKIYYNSQYLSKELINNECELGSDPNVVAQANELWSLGVILYTLVQGQYPIKGKRDIEITDAIMELSNVWKPEWKIGINENLKELLGKLLAPDYLERTDPTSFITEVFSLS